LCPDTGEKDQNPAITPKREMAHGFPQKPDIACLVQRLGYGKNGNVPVRIQEKKRDCRRVVDAVNAGCRRNVALAEKTDETSGQLRVTGRIKPELDPESGIVFGRLEFGAVVDQENIFCLPPGRAGHNGTDG
jgi:hypothetical protein